jgi:hypothetical protein
MDDPIAITGPSADTHNALAALWAAGDDGEVEMDSSSDEVVSFTLSIQS